jgi:hypothetical protein
MSTPDNAAAPLPAAPAAMDGLFLHASSVIMPAGAFLFLGHSTAGKSTIARLLGTSFPILADDTVFASRNHHGQWVVIDGSFRMNPARFSTQWEHVVQQRPPTDSAPRLLGCLRIHKGDTVKAAPLSPWETCRFLMDAAMEVDIQRKLRTEPDAPAKGNIITAHELHRRRQWFHAVADIARNHPGWHLWFSKKRHVATLCTTVATLGGTATDFAPR